jgi:Tfp pilus assembly protein PilN
MRSKINVLVVKIANFLKKNEEIIKNVLNIVLFFIALLLLFGCYKFIEIKFGSQNKLNLEKSQNIIKEKNHEIGKLKKELFLSNIDILSDNSINKFVSNKVSFFDL